jgi:hypothetical protein
MSSQLKRLIRQTKLDLLVLPPIESVHYLGVDVSVANQSDIRARSIVEMQRAERGRFSKVT